MTNRERDHGGGLDAAISRHGGTRIGWIDLSTGINPQGFSVSSLRPDAWTALPDKGAMSALLDAARAFWNVPRSAEILATAGASSAIAQIPTLLPPARAAIPGPTYNEHAAAFTACGWTVVQEGPAEAQVVVHPNNPDGHIWTAQSLPAAGAKLTVIDESFCDVMPERSLTQLAARPGTLVLKSFGKFWGLAGARLGFVIGDPALINPLRDRLGPWAVSGPALHLGAAALQDIRWADATRQELVQGACRLDDLMQRKGARVVGGTSLFRLYQVSDAVAWQERLAQQHIWTRVFPYNSQWLRMGLPHPLHWPRLISALA